MDDTSSPNIGHRLLVISTCSIWSWSSRNRHNTGVFLPDSFPFIVVLTSGVIPQMWHIAHLHNCTPAHVILNVWYSSYLRYLSTCLQRPHSPSSSATRTQGKAKSKITSKQDWGLKPVHFIRALAWGRYLSRGQKWTQKRRRETPSKQVGSQAISERRKGRERKINKEKRSPVQAGPSKPFSCKTPSAVGKINQVSHATLFAIPVLTKSLDFRSTSPIILAPFQETT